MADKKEPKKKGVVTNYNKMPVTKRGYYYDYNEVSKAEQGFADSFTDLAVFNTKLTDELKKEKTVKLTIHDGETIKEGLLAAGEWVNNVATAKIEFKDYQRAGGKGDFQEFLKAAIQLIKDGTPPKSGSDVAKNSWM
jgi:hypothetical protein